MRLHEITRRTTVVKGNMSAIARLVIGVGIISIGTDARVATVHIATRASTNGESHRRTLAKKESTDTGSMALIVITQRRMRPLQQMTSRFDSAVNVTSVKGDSTQRRLLYWTRPQQTVDQAGNLARAGVIVANSPRHRGLRSSFARTHSDRILHRVRIQCDIDCLALHTIYNYPPGHRWTTNGEKPCATPAGDTNAASKLYGNRKA